VQWLQAADRPRTTIKLRKYQLGRLAERCRNPWKATSELLLDWLGNPNWGTETRRSMRSALRSFYGWAHASGRIDHNPAALLPPIKPKEPKARPTPEPILRSALHFADERVQLMILLGARQGLRRGEIAVAHTDDVIEDLAGYSLRVHGKGRKIRIIPLRDEIARRILTLPKGYLFPGNYQGQGHLSPYWVARLVRRCLDDGWTTHTLRHRFVTKTYRGTRDIHVVQRLAGHARPETTQMYIEMDDESMRAALVFAA
jgi:integrase/recombinase XerC